MIKVSQYGAVIRFDLARTFFGSGRYWTTAYLIDGLMIDTGCAYSAPELLQYLNSILVNQIINTHTHEDHIGTNALIKHANPGMDIFAHPLALPVLDNPRQAQPLHPYRRLFWGWPQPSRANSLKEGQIVRTTNFSFQIVFTPGHSRDHLCVFEPDQGWLFSGDLFVGGQDRALRQDCDIWGMISSLKKVAALPIKILFPGSAKVRDNPHVELCMKIEFYERFGDRVRELNSRGWSVSKIVGELCGGPMWIEFVTLGHFSRQHLVRSFLGMYTAKNSVVYS